METFYSLPSMLPFIYSIVSWQSYEKSSGMQKKSSFFFSFPRRSNFGEAKINLKRILIIAEFLEKQQLSHHLLGYSQPILKGHDFLFHTLIYHEALTGVDHGKIIIF